MKLSLCNRREEIGRIERLIGRKEGALGVLYGRRRCGKSRLLREVLPRETSVFYIGDDREGALQRRGLAVEIGRLLPGFERVDYPDWDALLSRWWGEAPKGSILAIDEFPALVDQAPELPSLLQKRLDREVDRGLHLLLTGSSQRMMYGLVLDRGAPLFGRAVEILKISPLPAGWITDALGIDDPARAIEVFAVWGGTPRYWELAADFDDARRAIAELVLSPLGVLHEEPGRLLLDDMRETAQASSILSLIGQGCHRMSEIAARLGKPATSLSRPLQRLLDMGFVRREIPFGAPPRGGKRALYRIADPFLLFWYRFVGPQRSRLEARLVDAVAGEIEARFPHHVGEIWEELVRASVPRSDLFGKSWGSAARWWGPGTDRNPLELDLVAESLDGDELLVGEVKWSMPRDPARLLWELEAKAARCPIVGGRKVHPVLWLRDRAEGMDERVVTPGSVLGALR